MLLPAVQEARESAKRMACADNLRQLGIGLQTYIDSYNVYPQECTSGCCGYNQWTIYANILPFIDEGNVQRACHSGNGNGDTIKVFLCPSRHNSGGFLDYGYVGGSIFVMGGPLVTLTEIANQRGTAYTPLQTHSAMDPAFYNQGPAMLWQTLSLNNNHQIGYTDKNGQTVAVKDAHGVGPIIEPASGFCPPSGPYANVGSPHSSQPYVFADAHVGFISYGWKPSGAPLTWEQDMWNYTNRTWAELP